VGLERNRDARHLGAMRNTVLALVLALIPAIASADVQRFDLDCKGSTDTGAAWAKRISVDLGANAWCEQPCATPRPINAVQPGFVILWDESPAGEHNPAAPVANINRITGGYFEHDGVGTILKGACAVAPFTALPKALF
jgi:hypothetical protein